MKTKEEIIAVIEKIKSLNIALSVADYEAVLHYLKLSTLNRMRIDEERFYRRWRNMFPKDDWELSSANLLLQDYNSTIKDHQVLQPLPKDIPAKIGRMICEYASDNNMSIDDMWQELIKHYGTPTKKELVSVEELEKEIRIAYNKVDSSWKSIAQHIIDTYSLNPAKRDEFPFNLKKGDKFKIEGSTRVLDSISLNATDGVSFPLSECTPCIEPSIHDKVKEKLGIELYEELMKEVKGA